MEVSYLRGESLQWLHFVAMAIAIASKYIFTSAIKLDFYNFYNVNPTRVVPRHMEDIIQSFKISGKHVVEGYLYEGMEAPQPKEGYPTCFTIL